MTRATSPDRGLDLQRTETVRRLAEQHADHRGALMVVLHAVQAELGHIDRGDVEAIADVSLRICPIADADAESMMREVKMYPLLEAIRGEPRRDTRALADALLRLSQLALRHPEIAEMDVNPLISLERGATAVDARIQLASPVAALLGTATPLQMLTERIARARGVDPDAIHRDVDRYRGAADAAED